MIDDKSLRRVLKAKIDLIKTYPRSVQKQVEFEMAQTYNVKYGDTVDIFNEITPVDDLDYNMLFKLMKSIHVVGMKTNEDKQFDISGLDENKYFHKDEIEEFSTPFPEEEKDFDLIITDWKQMSENKIKIYTNIDEVTNIWRNYKKLRFNPKTQRDLLTVRVNDKTRKKLDINRNAVNEMKSLMKKGMYYNVCGILNINPELYELPYRDGKNLIIPKESHIDIIEGFHNYLAATELKDEFPDFTYDMEFNLMLLTTDEANDLIIQMDKKTHLRQSQVIREDRLNEINYVINSLNSRPTFHFYGTMDNDIKLHLNKLLTKLYGTINDRIQSIKLISTLEKDLNFIIENNLGTKNFTKNDYFVYLTLIHYIESQSLNFMDIYPSLKLDCLFENTSIYSPTQTNMSYIKNKVKEVVENAL